jgi:hypothetical protein
MEITLLDNALIRRFGKRTLEVDSSVGLALISKGLAFDTNKVKQVKSPPKDKMIKKPMIDKSEKPEMDCSCFSEQIFPDLIIVK